MKIAISGKGGVGKTTLAALLAQAYADGGRQVLAVDADPSPCLAGALGFPEELRERLHPIAEMDELIEERSGACACWRWVRWTWAAPAASVPKQPC